MAENEPDRDEISDEELLAQEALFDSVDENDGLLTNSLANLSKVQVPSGFLPGVMFRVFEKHHREKVALPFILGIATALLALCATFFCLDVWAYSKEPGRGSFSASFDLKLEFLSDHASQLVSDMSGLFAATWQIVSGVAGATPNTTLVFLVLGLLLLLYLIKKGLTALMG